MTYSDVRDLEVGERVIFCGDTEDVGTVLKISPGGIEIKWDSGLINQYDLQECAPHLSYPPDPAPMHEQHRTVLELLRTVITEFDKDDTDAESFFEFVSHYAGSIRIACKHREDLKELDPL